MNKTNEQTKTDQKIRNIRMKKSTTKLGLQPKKDNIRYLKSILKYEKIVYFYSDLFFE